MHRNEVARNVSVVVTNVDRHDEQIRSLTFPQQSGSTFQQVRTDIDIVRNKGTAAFFNENSYLIPTCDGDAKYGIVATVLFRDTRQGSPILNKTQTNHRMGVIVCPSPELPEAGHPDCYIGQLRPYSNHTRHEFYTGVKQGLRSSIGDAMKKGIPVLCFVHETVVADLNPSIEDRYGLSAVVVGSFGLYYSPVFGEWVTRRHISIGDGVVSLYLREASVIDGEGVYCCDDNSCRGFGMQNNPVRYRDHVAGTLNMEQIMLGNGEMFDAPFAFESIIIPETVRDAEVALESLLDSRILGIDSEFNGDELGVITIYGESDGAHIPVLIPRRVMDLPGLPQLLVNFFGRYLGGGDGRVIVAFQKNEDVNRMRARHMLTQEQADQIVDLKKYHPMRWFLPEFYHLSKSGEAITKLGLAKLFRILNRSSLDETVDSTKVDWSNFSLAREHVFYAVMDAYAVFWIYKWRQDRD